MEFIIKSVPFFGVLVTLLIHWPGRRDILVRRKRDQVCSVIDAVSDSPIPDTGFSKSRGKLQAELDAHFSPGMDYRAVIYLLNFNHFPERLRKYARYRFRLKLVSEVNGFEYFAKGPVDRWRWPTKKRKKFLKNLMTIVYIIWVLVLIILWTTQTFYKAGFSGYITFNWVLVFLVFGLGFWMILITRASEATSQQLDLLTLNKSAQ